LAKLLLGTLGGWENPLPILLIKVAFFFTWLLHIWKAEIVFDIHPTKVRYK
jgi:hypothetical protein